MPTRMPGPNATPPAVTAGLDREECLMDAEELLRDLRHHAARLRQCGFLRLAEGADEAARLVDAGRRELERDPADAAGA